MWTRQASLVRPYRRRDVVEVENLAGSVGSAHAGGIQLLGVQSFSPGAYTR